MRISNKNKYIFLIFVVCSGPIFGAIASILYRSEQSPDNLTFLQLLNGIFCVLLFIMAPLRRDVKYLKIFPPMCFFASFIFFTAAFREYELQSFVYSFRLVFLAIIFISFHLMSRNDILRVRELKIIAWIILSSVVFSQYVGWVMGFQSKTYGLEFVMGGLTGKVSTLSGYLASIVPIFFIGDRINKADLVGFSILILAAIFTFKRTLWIVICLVLFLYFVKYFYSFSMKGRIKILSLTLMLVGFVYYIINNSPLGVEISYRLIDLDIASGGTGSGRTQIWDVAATYFINMDIVHTVFGYGAGHLPSVMSSALNNPIGAHNDWLDIAVSYGLCGLFLFLYFFISIFNLARKLFFSHDKNYLAVISCLIILLFYSAATGGVFNVTFVALFGILGFCSGGNQRLVSQALLPRSV